MDTFATGLVAVAVAVVGCVVAAVYIHRSIERARAQAMAAKEDFLGIFDGAKEQVFFQVTPRTPDAPTMIAGAIERGYELTSRADGTFTSDLVFKRRV